MSSNNVLFCASQATMAVSISVFLYEGFAYNMIFLGRILPAVHKEAYVTPFMIAFNLVWGLAMLSYLMAHATDPGRVPKGWQDFVREVQEALPVAPARPEWQPGKATYCKKCDIPRPERAHHCLVCEVCVLRMDHHCPWINNCVGFQNYKFFILLGTYACMASSLAVASALPELISCAGALATAEGGIACAPMGPASFVKYEGFISSGENIFEDMLTLKEAEVRCDQIPACKGFTFQGTLGDDGRAHIYFKDKWDIWGTGWTSFQKVHENEVRLEVTDIVGFLIFGLLALFVAVLLIPMLATHLPLALQNVTTIEDNYENMPNPFDQGSSVANLAQVFGRPGLDWLIPVRPLKPLSDGVSFARSDERLDADGMPERQEGEPEVTLTQEDLWRRRYRVRLLTKEMQDVGAGDENGQGPLTSLARWWAGGAEP